jgi:hypothetical protein
LVNVIEIGSPARAVHSVLSNLNSDASTLKEVTGSDPPLLPPHATATVETKSNTPSKATVSRTPHFILTWLLLHIRIEVDKLGGWEEEMSTNRNFLCLMLDEEALTTPVEG